MQVRRTTIFCTVACLWIGAVGCARVARPSHRAMQSPIVADRVSAVRAAAERGDRASVPQLVDRLDDEDAVVRFAAVVALERITGTRLGYRYGASAGERAAAVERWRRFLSER